MTVYVDPLIVGPWGPGGRYKYSCHLFADTRAELLAFGQLIGMKVGWFQQRPGKLPHFDLTQAKRALAIKHGAVQLERRQAVAKIRELLPAWGERGSAR